MLPGFRPGSCVEQISNELRDGYKIEGLEEVRVIRDRQTSMSCSLFPFVFFSFLTLLAEKSRQLGFLRFQSIDYSRAFLEPNFPSIFLYGPNPVNERGTRVRIAYSREREDRARTKAEGDWVCKVVSLCSARTIKRMIHKESANFC